MKKYVNGKRYDTDTAKEIGSWEQYLPTDFNYIKETLYRKQSGEYFIHGKGGPRTCYAVQTEQNAWSGGESIMPKTYEDARQWAMDNLSVDEFDAEFGEVPEDDNIEVFAVRLRKDTAEKIRRAAAAEHMTIGECLEKHLDL